MHHMNKCLPKTDVPWADRQWPVLRGCSAVSEGCKNCYAQQWHHRFAAYMGLPAWGAPHFLPDNLDMPLHTRKPYRVFVAPMSDFFHESVDPVRQDQAGLVMAKSTPCTFILLTKRPQNIGPWIGRMIDDGLWPMPNVWLGVTAENQARADERVPLLLAHPAAVHVVSVEPMLGPVDLSDGLFYTGRTRRTRNAIIDWVIAGPETGRGARPCRDEWIGALANQSPCFFDKRKAIDGIRREFPRGCNS